MIESILVNLALGIGLAIVIGVIIGLIVHVYNYWKEWLIFLGVVLFLWALGRGTSSIYNYYHPKQHQPAEAPHQ